MFFFALPVLAASNAAAPARPDASSEIKIPPVNKPGSATDSSLRPEELLEEHAVPVKITALKTASTPPADSSGLIGLARTAPCADSMTMATREMLRKMGSFHTAMGIYTVSAGALAVIAGATILHKEDILPFSLSLITLGGITVGIGVWEITIGRSLSR